MGAELTSRDLSYISSDWWQCWCVDGHVPLDQFTALAEREGADLSKFPAAAHGWLHETDVPDDEDADSWYEPCEESAPGAFPVTFIARDW